MRNPVQKRLQTETLIRLSETFLGKKNFSWWAIIYAALVFLVSGWFPDGIAELLRVSMGGLFEKEWFSGIYKILFSLVVMSCIGFILKRAIKKHTGKVEVEIKQSPYVKVLAIFLSILSIKRETQEKELKVIEDALSKGTLDETAFNNKPWEMPIIAIKHHIPTLEFLYVFTSSGENGSSKLMPVFTKVINSLFPKIKVKEFTEGGIDFENVREVFGRVEELYQDLKEKGVADKEVIIDITGGQKPNTIAGAMATLAFGRKFQYVSTIYKTVNSYDIAYFEGGTE
ncbi:MAG: hypothetical protein ACK415_05840 [Thermodesulfovibrionales bacterium]